MKITKYSIVFSLFFVAFSYAQNKYTGNVGINTDNPKNNLDIRGDLRLTPDEFKKDGNYSPLFRVKNAESGDHKVVKKGLFGNIPEKEKEILKFDLIVKLNDVGKDNCTFDTKIPTSEYNLIIINSELEDISGNPAAISHIDPSLAESSNNGYATENSPKQVNLTESKSGTWVISADFPRTTAVTRDPSGKTQWFFSLLAVPVSNSTIIDPNPTNNPNSLSKKAFKLNENMSDTAPNNPIN